MGNSGRRGQRLVQDGATAREQQRRLIEEARAARRGEQIAEPHQPSRSKLDRVEVPFYPDDLLPKMQQLLAILNDLDHRYETDRYNLQSWSGPQATKEHLLADLERCHRANRERFEACLRSCTGSVANSGEKRGMDERWLGGSAPDNCLLTTSEQYDVVSHRRRFLPLPWPLFGAAFCLWALSGVPPTGVTGEHGHNGLLFSECLNQPSNGFLEKLSLIPTARSSKWRTCSSSMVGWASIHREVGQHA